MPRKRRQESRQPQLINKDNLSGDGFNAVSNRFLVYIQANVVNTFHRVPPCGSDWRANYFDLPALL